MDEVERLVTDLEGIMGENEGLVQANHKESNHLGININKKELQDTLGIKQEIEDLDDFHNNLLRGDGHDPLFDQNFDNIDASGGLRLQSLDDNLWPSVHSTANNRNVSEVNDIKTRHSIPAGGGPVMNNLNSTNPATGMSNLHVPGPHSIGQSSSASSNYNSYNCTHTSPNGHSNLSNQSSLTGHTHASPEACRSHASLSNQSSHNSLGHLNSNLSLNLNQSPTQPNQPSQQIQGPSFQQMMPMQHQNPMPMQNQVHQSQGPVSPLLKQCSPNFNQITFTNQLNTSAGTSDSSPASMHHQIQSQNDRYDRDDREPNPNIGLWAKVRTILEENLTLFQSIYGPQFPIQFVQIRSHYADIIEQQKWHLINVDEPTQKDEFKAIEMFKNVLSSMQHKCEHTEEVDQKLLLYNLGTYFQNVYGNAPLELVRLMNKVMTMEKNVLAQSASKNSESGSAIDNKVAISRKKVGETNIKLDGLMRITGEIDILGKLLNFRVD